MLAVIMLPAVASAEQYQGTFEEQEACKPDVFRLCGNYIPDVDRIVACLKTNRPHLSPSCHDVFFDKSKAKKRAH